MLLIVSLGLSLRDGSWIFHEPKADGTRNPKLKIHQNSMALVCFHPMIFIHLEARCSASCLLSINLLLSISPSLRLSVGLAAQTNLLHQVHFCEESAEFSYFRTKSQTTSLHQHNMSGFGLGSASAAASDQPIDNSTPWVAAADGNLALVQSSLTTRNLPAGASDEHGYTLLQAAASYSHMNVLKWLLTQDIDVNAVDNEGDTALHYASTAEAARFLIEVAKVDQTIRNQGGRTALQSKREELEEMQLDEDYDEDDQDAVNLRAVIGYLSSLSSVAQ